MNAARHRDLLERLLADSEESAAVRLFVDLCRGSSALRTWLWDEFAGNAEARKEFARWLESDAPPPPRFAILGGASALREAEAEAIRARLPAQPYGGLTLEALKALLVEHQAGKIDPAAFVFALQWQKQNGAAATSPALVSGARDFLARALAEGGATLLRDLGKAAEFARSYAQRGQRRASLGFADWWKLQLLLYILRHPAPAYSTRELCAHLTSLGLHANAREVRRYCIEHGIRRDMRAGRPARTTDRNRRRPATRRRPSRIARAGR